MSESTLTQDYRSLVFLMDDQPIVAEALRRQLAGEADISLHYCSVASDAITMATEVKPTVILQDLVLPDADGFDMVRHFRANPATATIPIIVLSTKEDAMAKSRAFAVGANDYVVKLPDPMELMARIRYHSRAYLNGLQRDAAFRALHQSQQQLLATNTSLTAANQRLNEFVGIAAHDLRNPLGVISGFAKVLLRDTAGSLSPQQHQFIGAIESSADFMLRLVNDLLDVSEIEAGKLTLKCEPTNLVQLVESTVSMIRLLAAEKDISITTEAEGAIPGLRVDPHRIEQVLTNLLTNAVKYSNSHTTVSVGLGCAGRDVVLSVRDKGQGIPPKELNRLFLPFGTTSVRGTRGEKSTGLGLMIVKKVVDAHGGRIWVESVQGEGSCFYVALPTADPRPMT